MLRTDLHSYLLILILFLRQINDLDVSRCREGRLDYLGSASFILIAGLMSCLMVNESMGDAFIDAAMPSFFSSIYILANALYKISLPAILCPSIAVVGIFLYYTLVYRRAKKSHQKRKILRQTRKRNSDIGREDKLFRQNTRRPREAAYGVVEFVQRLLVSLNDGIVTVIVHISDKRLKKRVTVESAYSHRWCAMNKPALHQGTMLSNRVRNNTSVIRLEGEYNGEDSANNGHDLVRRRKIVPNPPEIIRMVKASQMWWTVHDGQLNTIAGSLSITVQPADHLFRSDYPVARESRRELRATIFFDTGEALLRVWSNLLIAAVHEKGMGHDWKVELFEVPASVLLKELRNIFDAFYPDGIPMSEVEKREACELFSKWIQGQESSQSSDGVCSHSQMIPFKAFHGWFYDLSEMIHQSTYDRLLSHILLLTQRSNAASADAVRLLNVIAPKHSHTIYKTYISVRPSSVVALPLNSMCTENPFFGSPLISRHSHNPSGQDSIPDIKGRTDGNDLYSTYGQSPEGGRLSDSIYPMNDLEGSPRNFTYPQKIHDVNKSNDLYCAYPKAS